MYKMKYFKTRLCVNGTSYSKLKPSNNRRIDVIQTKRRLASSLKEFLDGNSVIKEIVNNRR